MADKKNIPEPSIPNWVKLLNQYNTDYYSSGKLIKAEEWNALFAATVAQGNYHSNTLDLLINTYLPEKWEEVLAFENTIKENITEFKAETDLRIAKITELTAVANSNANKAVANSESAVQTANTAKEISDTAKDIAENAEAIAYSAQTSADAVLGTAETAKSIAENANTVAENALELAETTKVNLETTQTNLNNNYYTKADTDVLFNDLINGAPEQFDTLKEIADWIANDESGTAALINRVTNLENDSTTIENSILDLQTNKVDKVSGKGLSTNDYTTLEKNKLAGIQEGAQVNPIIDSELSTTSTNPIQNATVTTALNNKANITDIPDTSGFITESSLSGRIIPSTSSSKFAGNGLTLGRNTTQETLLNPSLTANNIWFSRYGTLLATIGRYGIAFNGGVNSADGSFGNSIEFAKYDDIEKIVKYKNNITGKEFNYDDLVTNADLPDTSNFVTSDALTDFVTNTDLEGRVIPKESASSFQLDGGKLYLRKKNYNISITLDASSNAAPSISVDKTSQPKGVERTLIKPNEIYFQKNNNYYVGSIKRADDDSGIVYRGLTNDSNTYNLKYNLNDVQIQISGNALQNALTTAGTLNIGKVYTCTENSTDNSCLAGHLYLIGGTSGAYTLTDITASGNAGTVINIADVPQSVINFDSDPQTQISSNASALNKRLIDEDTPVTNLNTLTKSGLYRCSGEAIGSPYTSAESISVLHLQFDTTNAVQLAYLNTFQYAGVLYYARTKNTAGEWSSWARSVTNIAGFTGYVTTSDLISVMLTGANGFGDKIIDFKTNDPSTSYIRFASGLLIAWGQWTVGRDITNYLHTYGFNGFTFANTNYTLTFQLGVVGYNDFMNGVGFNSKSTTGFYYSTRYDQTELNWFAIGKWAEV